MNPETLHKRDFAARVKANDVPIARLIGFEVKEMGEGRSVLTIECEITDEQGRLVAKVSSTCMALMDHRAKGR